MCFLGAFSCSKTSYIPLSNFSLSLTCQRIFNAARLWIYRMKVGHFSNLGLSLLCLSEHCWAVVNELFLSLTDNRRNYFRKFYAHFSLVIYYYIVPFNLKTGANTVCISPWRLPGKVPEETVFAFVLFSAYFYTIFFLWTSRKTLSPGISEARAAHGAIHPTSEQLCDCHQEDNKKAHGVHHASEWHFVVPYEKRRHPRTHKHFHAIPAGCSAMLAEPYQLHACTAQRSTQQVPALLCSEARLCLENHSAPFAL